MLSAIVLETAIVIVVLSRVLPHGANRWRNVIVGLLQTDFAATSLIGNTVPDLFSVFFVVIEVATTVFIVWYAWTWPRPNAAAPARGWRRLRSGEASGAEATS